GRVEDEGWRVRKGGTRFWADVVTTAIRDSSGRLTGFAKVARDLSDRRAAEEALRQSEERLRLLVESVQDYAIVMLDPQGKVATWNVGAERTLGYRTEEILGQHLARFYRPEDAQLGRPERELLIARHEGRFEEEGWRVRNDGSLFWANAVLRPMWGPGGELVGYAKVTRDLTERRAAGQERHNDAQAHEARDA